jgi:hypothetical protein
MSISLDLVCEEPSHNLTADSESGGGFPSAKSQSVPERQSAAYAGTRMFLVSARTLQS